MLRKYDNQGEISKLLITELKKGKYEMINEFLKNPLLVSLLFAAFDYKQTIPLKKHVFYRQVYDAYFDSHDLSKGGGYTHEKLSGLDIDDFDRVLRHVGFRCLKYQKIEFDKDTLLKIISEVKNDCSDLNFSESDFFQDILHAVPLFCNDGQYYKWVHKSIQEYFAAQFIYKDSKENQDVILTAMYKSENVDKYINLLDIYSDIDNWGFRKNIIKLICTDYCNFYEKNRLDCNEMKIEDDKIEDRIGNIFMNDTLILKHITTNKDKKHENPFSLLTDKTKELLYKKANRISFYHGLSIFVASYIYPIRTLMNLIYNKYPFLFKKQTNIVTNNELSLENEKIYNINLHSFENNSIEYEIINLYLQRNNKLELEFTPVFDYKACKEEINKINSIISKQSRTSTLVDGL